MTVSFPPRIRPGLDRVRRALGVLGHPEEDFAAVLVGGTNGKGSVSAFLASILLSAGHRVGLYTSPHLVSVRERVQVDGRPVSAAGWARATARVAAEARRHRIRLTEFEAQTLAAFLVFSLAGVDLAVLEVGLGGRWDAVNAVPMPELAVISSIGLDHTDWLGPTLRHIYREKRGIARPGTPLLQALPRCLMGEARRFARESGVFAWTLGRDIRLTAVREDRSRLYQRMEVRLPSARFDKLTVPLWGRHQAQNGALAVAAAHLLSRRGWRVKPSAIRRGLANARWPGRFDIRGRRPPVVLDGAHNVAAARALAAAWRASPWGRRKAVLLFACLKDKDAEGMIRVLAPLANRVIVTSVPSPRARPPGELAALWSRRAPTTVAAEFKEAWRNARRDRGEPVLVTGSLYLVGEALRTMRRKS